MMFRLTALNVAYVLNPLLETILEVSQDTTPIEKAKVADLKKKRQEDEFVCQGHILNTLLDCLYDLCMPITSPIKIGSLWKQSTMPTGKVLTSF